MVHEKQTSVKRDQSKRLKKKDDQARNKKKDEN